MTDMAHALQKQDLSEFTRAEFLAFVEALFSGAAGSEAEDVEHILHFKRIVYPDLRGSDLIFYPQEGVEDTPEGVVGQVEKFRRENGLPGFRKAG